MKVLVPLVPAEVETVTERSPVVASFAITKVAVIEVLLSTLTDCTVTPVPLTVTVVVPNARFAPVKVTLTD